MINSLGQATVDGMAEDKVKKSAHACRADFF
jgi:hypothetical protein